MSRNFCARTLDLDTNKVTIIRSMPRADVRFNSRSGTPRQFSLSPDGKALAITVEASEGDIWILNGFRPEPPLHEKLLGAFFGLER